MTNSGWRNATSPRPSAIGRADLLGLRRDPGVEQRLKGRLTPATRQHAEAVHSAPEQRLVPSAFEANASVSFR